MYCPKHNRGYVTFCPDCLNKSPVLPPKASTPTGGEAPFDFTPWIPPFSYDAEGSRIVDSQDHLILDVRGWGFLTGKGYAALGLREEVAECIQNKLGSHVTKLLNIKIRGGERQR